LRMTEACSTASRSRQHQPNAQLPRQLRASSSRWPVATCGAQPVHARVAQAAALPAARAWLPAPPSSTAENAVPGLDQAPRLPARNSPGISAGWDAQTPPLRAPPRSPVFLISRRNAEEATVALAARIVQVADHLAHRTLGEGGGCQTDPANLVPGALQQARGAALRAALGRSPRRRRLNFTQACSCKPVPRSHWLAGLRTNPCGPSQCRRRARRSQMAACPRTLRQT